MHGMSGGFPPIDYITCLPEQSATSRRHRSPSHEMSDWRFANHMYPQGMWSSAPGSGP